MKGILVYLNLESILRAGKIFQQIEINLLPE